MGTSLWKVALEGSEPLGLKLGSLGDTQLAHGVFFPRRAFQQFYKQFVEYTCPTEDIYLE